MTQLKNVRLFITHPHDCSYLPEEKSTTVFVDPDVTIDQHSYTQFSALGFRRSGAYLYRPQCPNCTACTPSRIPVTQFQQNRSQRRIWRKNSDLLVGLVDNISAAEFYTLYESYIVERHSDGDMFPPSKEQYENFLTKEWNVTHYLAYKSAGKLLALSVVDILDDGISAIYTFFDPKCSKRSLGVYSVLWLVKYAIDLGLPYLYLGYWIKNCEKMRYKLNYRPNQLLINGRWLTVR